MATSAPQSKSGMYFVTTSTYHRRPIFQVSRLAELFIQTLLDHRRHGRLKLHAYLVLPDHVHLLLTPQALPLDATVNFIKDSFANLQPGLQPVWNESFSAHPIPTLRALESLRRYLHNVPVQANLTLTPELYPYSSAHRMA
jgi:putative transposase